MKLALLSGANPQACKECAIVRLPKGRWRIHVHGLEDSVLTMHVGPTKVELKDHVEIDVATNLDVQACFEQRGRERYITAFAERL